MLSRRELIAGGAAVHMAGGDAAAAQREATTISAASCERFSDVLDAIRCAIHGRDADGEPASRTAAQFLRLNQRFPECIDVGIRVWEQMQDWHIRHLRAAHDPARGRWSLADGLHHVGARAEARAATTTKSVKRMTARRCLSRCAAGARHRHARADARASSTSRSRRRFS